MRLIVPESLPVWRGGVKTHRSYLAGLADGTIDLGGGTVIDTTTGGGVDTSGSTGFDAVNLNDPNSGFGTVDMTGGGAVSSSSPINLAQFAQLLGTSTSAAVNILRATQQPGLVPGTNVIYDPTTGRLSSAVGYTGNALASGAANVVSAFSPTMIGIAAIAVVLVIAMGKK